MIGDEVKIISDITRKNNPAHTAKSKRHLILHESVLSDAAGH